MTISTYGPGAQARQQFESADFGNARVALQQVEFAAVEQDEVVAIAKVPPHSRLYALGEVHDAMGASTGLTYAYESLDGQITGTIKAVADASSAGNSLTVLEPVDTGDTGLYITAKQTGASTATGTVAVSPHYVHDGQ